MTTGSSAPDPSPVPGPDSVPVVGRDAAVERLVQAVRTGSGAVVTGERGIGRRAVVRAAAERLAATGARVIRADAPLVGPTRPEAFASLRDVLPAEPPTVVDAGTLAAVGERLLAGAGRPGGDGAAPGPVVVVLGEVEEVDAPSVAVLHQLVAADRVALLGTARTDDGGGDGARTGPAPGWWRGLVERVPLGPLDRGAADALVEALLGGPADASSRGRVWGFTRGHPGWVAAVVDATRAAGAWERSSGPWSLVGDLDALVDAGTLVEVDRAPVPVRSVLVALALAGTLPVTAAEAVDGPAPLAEAERRGLVVAEDDHGTLWCRPASEMIATAARAGLDPVERAARWARIADVLAAEQAGGEVAIVRGRALVGSGRLEGAASPGEVGAVVDAASAAAARSRWGVAAELAEVAWRRGDSQDGLRILTHAWAEMGDHDALRRVAAEVEAADLPAEDRAHHAETIAASRFHLGDAEGAWATFARARAEAGPEVQGIIDLGESRLRAFAGQPAEAAAIAERWAEVGDPELRIVALQVVGSAVLHRGRLADAIAVFDRALALVAGAPESLSALAGVPFLFRLSVATDLGRFAEATDGALAVEPSVAAGGDPSAHGWLALHLGRTALTAGHPATAVRWFGEAVSDLRRVHRPGWLGYPSAGLAAALALAGDMDAASEARERWASIPAHAVSLFRSEELRLDATYLAGTGDVEGADERLREAIALAERNGSLPYRVHALHALARLGLPGSRQEAAAGLEAAAVLSDSPLFAAHARRARAVVEGDVASLTEVGAWYEAMGARLDAVECWAAVACRSVDDRPRAHAARRVAQLRAGGEDLTSPLLADVGDGPVLTAREAEIAALVAQGASRQEIADQLVVSVRTIDSHLRRVYRKLGVRGRDDLAALDGGAGPGGPSPDDVAGGA